MEPDFEAEPDYGRAGDAPGATGHRAVDAALKSLENAAELPVGEQIAAYEAAHRTLRETLSTIDDA
ncbi:MAG: hypothetical protein HOV71_13780 [Hamadaea sp.]|nr:hypothetical protein [Hamadaea sp.]NUR49201.1 hypothetical protein [Hamadaea sp.]